MLCVCRCVCVCVYMREQFSAWKFYVGAFTGKTNYFVLDLFESITC